MLPDIKGLVERAKDEIASCGNKNQLEAIRIKYIGKKGELTALLRSMGGLSPEDRPKFGQAVNEAKEEIEGRLAVKSDAIVMSAREKQFIDQAVDITLPGRIHKIGNLHPITKGFEEICDIFVRMGFSVVEGPEVETDFYNFTALNTPPFHPARDVQDTFYITDNILLRTHTSPQQARQMEKQEPPVKVVVPGRVYRRDQVDATHSPEFHQLEGLYVDKGVTFAHLKGALEMFIKAFYGEDKRVRFRPHYFPFTEPSAEMDVSCFACGGKGCRICKGEGWIEILGSGMVHPNVLSTAGYDPELYSGFAFGMGIDRIVSLKYGVDDLRLYFENDIRFLEAF
ncbi:MAG TPA: phenylalanine--tRNA ligase subunit alpha [Bacillota bacterium]|nr:phenylalanine--tRNA ligase subunit alpha [Bacillota bacterium]HOH10491.1 phenylalanine--tRNA ligase subunit alpha [Bacillota bacterium]HPI02019.1 phenylalanine--tRNA ligase subunit alpha [Bacillota bacterium]HPM63204.1 phenylalanine--tRNA ligase subunit alpha [Bacillota bacterium]HQJ24832.1 phenylalanine--tRNA ligase subunit alpha [Bacillota bacterium]